MTKDEALKLAHEALGFVMSHGPAVQKAKDVIADALEQPERPWVGLTDAELGEFSDAKLGSYDLCLEVEAKLKEKNCG